MKSAGLWMLAGTAVTVLALQGCAGTQRLVYANGAAPANGQRAASGATWEATGPDSAIIKSSAPGQPVVKADTKENFEAVVAAIHKQMGPGGRWQFVSATERSTIDSNFADMQKLYDKYGSVDKMDTNATLRLASDQSTINAILTQKDGDRLICESVVPVGSHLPIKTCRTFAQIQEEQRATQNQLMLKTQQGNWQRRH